MLRFVLINSVVEQRGWPALYEKYPSFSISSSSSIVTVDVRPPHRFDLSDGTCVCSEVRFLSVRSDLSMRLGLQLQSLVYDIIPPTPARIDYATGLEKAVS